MKRILSIVLAVLTVISTSVFAAPVLVSTVETAKEVTATSAEDSMAKVNAEGIHYTYADIVDMVTSMEQLALLPSESEVGAAATSYDRRSQYDEATNTYITWADEEVGSYNGSTGWQSNADGSGYIEDVNDDRGTGILAADITGAGAIFRSWFATVGEGNIDIYIDGATTPTISMTTAKFVDSASEDSMFYGLDNMVYTAAEGKNNYTPITFNESCRIVLREGWGNFYQFSYRLFGEGVSVEPIGSTFTDEQKAALTACNEKMGNCGEAPDTFENETTSSADCDISAGESVTVFETEGEGAITQFKVKFNTSPGVWREEALQKLELSMYWDGEETPSVWAPLGEFFATPGGRAYSSLPLGLEDDGTYYCYWYMPYAESAKIVVENVSDKDYDINVEVTTAPLTKSIDNYARFHAKWSMNRFLPERDDRGSDHTVLKATGKGRFLGFSLHLYMLTGGYWWGEGDEKFFVNGEKFPSTFGTGSEDYFGYAWGDGAYFAKAFHSQNWITGIFAEDSNINNVRFQVGDNVPFQTEFEASIEKFFNDDNTQYATTAFFYLDVDGTDPYTPVKYEGEEAEYRYMALDHAASETKYGTLLYRNDFERYSSSSNDQNIWGGETYVSPDLNQIRLSAEDSTIAFIADPLNESNHVLQIKQSGNYYTRATLYFAETMGDGMTKYGDYTLLGDVYIPQDFGNAKIGPMAFVYSDVSGHPGANKSTVWATESTGAWQKEKVFNFSILATQDLNLGTAENFNWGADGDNFRFIYFANMDSPTEGNSFYLDNLRLYFSPSARVEYNLGDLTSYLPDFAEHEYLKEGAEITDLTELAAQHGYEFKGWSKVSGTDTSAEVEYIVTPDDIAAQDVTLYAVLEKKLVSADNTVISGANGTATLTASEATEWTVDLGTTEASVSYTDTTLTITAAGYAGEVKVVAVSKADTQFTQEITVRLIGATKWKPGVDVVTGTTEPFGFEDVTQAQVFYGYANNWAGAFALMDDPDNDGNKVMGIPSDAEYKGWVTLHWTHGLSTAIEIERPIKVSYDYKGCTTDNWVAIGEGVSNYPNDIYVTPGAVTETWQSYSNTPVLNNDVKTLHADGITMMAFENGGDINGTNEYYIDNVSFVPYYKVEYKTLDGQLLDVQYILPDNGVYAPDAEYLKTFGANGFYLSADKNGGIQTSVTLENSDLVLYVDAKPIAYNDSSIRADDVCGIRFRAGVSTVQKSGATEYGFLIARQTVLAGLNKELTFELESETATNGAASVIVSGVSYKNDGSVDKIYAVENDIIQFTGVLTNIPAAYYDDVLTVRSYVKYEINGNEVVLYGDTVSKSMREVAKAIQTSDSDYYKAHKDKIDEIAGA